MGKTASSEAWSEPIWNYMSSSGTHTCFTYLSWYFAYGKQLTTPKKMMNETSGNPEPPQESYKVQNQHWKHRVRNIFHPTKINLQQFLHSGGVLLHFSPVAWALASPSLSRVSSDPRPTFWRAVGNCWGAARGHWCWGNAPDFPWPERVKGGPKDEQNLGEMRRLIWRFKSFGSCFCSCRPVFIWAMVHVQRNIWYLLIPLGLFLHADSYRA